MTEQLLSSMESPLLELTARNLRVSYDTQVALSIPHLQCQAGIIALVGHNGAGKSTLIKATLGLLPPTSGTLDTALRECGRVSRLIPENDMAFCPETGAVFADISVESYIKLWCRIKHNDSRFYMTRGSHYVEALNLVPLLGKLGRELSKGQRRRVQTAIGFLTEPKLFLFDEPFDGLDVQRTSELADLIMAHRHRMSFIISSHRMDVMERMADKLLVLKQGEVASVGPTEKVCSELAGVTYILSRISNQEQFRGKVQNEFPQALVTRIGTQLFVTDRNITLPKIQSIIAEIGERDVLIDTSSPRLVDAMNYHLAEMRKESLH